MLSSRPLSTGELDQQLFVDRQRELDVLARATRLRLSLAVTGDRGSGMTSLLNAHAAWLREHTDDNVVMVRGTDGMSDTSQVLRNVGTAAGVTVRRVSADVGTLMQLDATEPVSVTRREQLQRVAETAVNDGAATILIDGPLDAVVSDTLFGRWRDDLWEFTQLRWVVHLAGTPDGPASAFFDSVLSLEGLTTGFARKLVDARIASLQMEDAKEEARLYAGVDEIVQRADGNPGRLMAGLRTLALQPAWRADSIGRLLDRAGQMGGSHRVLVEVMANSPDQAVSASDPDLQDILDVTRGRIAAVLSELEEEGLVTKRRLAATGPGRPRTGYQLAVDDEPDQ